MSDPTAETWTACCAGLMTPEASVASLSLPLPGTGASWRSPGEPPYLCGASPEDKAKNIQSAMDRMLTDFPPGS